jgi:hypothetical protein
MMKCPSAGILQSMLDGELDIGLKKQTEQHLQQCPACKCSYDALKGNDDLVFTGIQPYREYFESENGEPFARKIFGKPASIGVFPSYVNSALPGNRNSMKGWNIMLNWIKKNHKLAAAACLILVLLVSVTVQPIRAAISNALTIFRVEKIKGITFTMEDIQKIQDQINQKNPNISMDQLGSMKMTGGENKQISLSEAAVPGDFQLMVPQNLTGSEPSVTQVDPARVEFTLKVNAVNELMKSFGASKLLPDSIDGKTVAVNMARQVEMIWQTGQSAVYLTETAKPSLEVPSDVDVDQIHDALLELPILPDNLKSQLKGITDWKNTLYFPIVGEVSEEVTINGRTAWIYSNGTADSGDPDANLRSSLVMIVDNTICALSGDMDKAELIALAQSLAPAR